MAKNKLVLCDTNILIELYKGNTSTVELLQKIGQENIAISIITSGELIYGALNKAELSKIKKDLSYLQILNIDQGVWWIFESYDVIFTKS